MADISYELQRIMQAVYGEEVRGSIHDAIDKINQVGEVVLSEGTAVTSPTSPTTGFFDGSFYFNTQTSDLWKCTGTGWLLVGNLEGASVESITKISTVGLVDTYRVNLTNGESAGTFSVTNGRDGTGSTLVSLDDVDVTSLTGEQYLEYDSTAEKWKNVSVDDSLSTTSHRPVRNSVIATVINNIQSLIQSLLGFVGWTLTTYTSSVSGGKVVITFTHSLIESTSEFHIYANGSSLPLFYTSATFSAGQGGADNSMTYEFNEADVTAGGGLNVITFSLKVRNDWNTPT